VTDPGQENAAPNIVDIDVADSANAGLYDIGENFDVGVKLYGDRAYTISSIPAGLSQLRGNQFVRTANGSKMETINPLLTVTLGTQSDVYVVSCLGRLNWMDASWVDTGLTIQDLEGTSNRTFNVYKKSSVPAGDLPLGPDLDVNGQNTAGRGMYFVVVDDNSN
jgi:hypothetical protein